MTIVTAILICSSLFQNFHGTYCWLGRPRSRCQFFSIPHSHGKEPLTTWTAAKHDSHLRYRGPSSYWCVERSTFLRPFTRNRRWANLNRNKIHYNLSNKVDKTGSLSLDCLRTDLLHECYWKFYYVLLTKLILHLLFGSSFLSRSDLCPYSRIFERGWQIVTRVDKNNCYSQTAPFCVHYMYLVVFFLFFLRGGSVSKVMLGLWLRERSPSWPWDCSIIAPVFYPRL